jgi:AraC-like DNA-binding protein
MVDRRSGGEAGPVLNHPNLAGQLPVAEIALVVEFADQSRFTRVFSGNEGISPVAWRRQRIN